MTEASYPSASGESRSQAISQKLGSFKKFASTSFTRARQYTVEKLGRADSLTEYDSELENLFEQLDQIKLTTEKILVYVESMVQPNPGLRLEGMVYNKLDKPRPQHTTQFEYLSSELTKAADEFGVDTQYGGYLKRCGEVERKIGVSERRFQEKANSDFIVPLKAFLEVDVKTILRDKKQLNIKRLDLDACKAKVKKTQDEEKVQSAETELRDKQATFDIHLDKVRKAVKKIVETHVNHLGHLKALISAQKSFHMECLAHIDSIENPGASIGGGLSATSADGGVGDSRSTKFEVQGIELDRADSKKAKVLYDYDADGELSVLEGNIIVVTPIPGNEEYVMAEQDGKFGKIPSNYIEIL